MFHWAFDRSQRQRLHHPFRVLDYKSSRATSDSVSHAGFAIAASRRPAQQARIYSWPNCRAISFSRAMRFSTLGCVEKRLSIPAPEQALVDHDM
jgi:hypothetical protein